MNLGLRLLVPEIILLSALVLIMLRETILGTKDKKGSLALFGWAAWLLLLVLLAFGRKTGSAFGSMLSFSAFSFFWKIFFVATFLVTLSVSKIFFERKSARLQLSDYGLVFWTSLLGLFLLASARHLLILFISLELLTMSLYIMTASLKRDSLAIEASLKYLVMGSLASAFLIFGTALVYFETGSLFFTAMSPALLESPVGKIALLFILTGLGFKIASFPFQLWVPDVYEGAPLPVTCYLATASKAAGFLLLVRIFYGVLNFELDFFMPLLGMLAVLTLLYGNLGALVQRNMKRLLGYSGIGHAGYLLVGLASGLALGVSAILYYLVAYCAATLTIFYCLAIALPSSGSDISELSGLGKRSPFLAAILFIGLLSLAGVPPLAGFFGKFLILIAGLKGGLDVIVLIGCLTVAVSLFYYLSVVKTMYFETDSGREKISVSLSQKVTLLILTAVTILVGVFQAPLMRVVEVAINSL